MGAVGFTLALVVWEGILWLTVEVSQGTFDHLALGKINGSGPMLHTTEGFSQCQQAL